MTNTVSKTVSDEYLNICIQIESSGNPKIKASTSSALGLGQFLNKTWLNVVSAHAPQVMNGKSQSQILALRLDPSFSIEMLARFTEDNQKIVGMDCTFGDLYLAHFLGSGTAKKLFRANPKTRVEPLVGDDAVRANRSILEGKTVAQVRAWANAKTAKKPAQNWIAKYYKPAALPTVAAIPQQAPDVSDALAPNGDPALRDKQVQLRGMRYYTGKLDGLWGSKTAGAISGILNDRGGQIPAPTSRAQYDALEPRIKSIIDEAEAANWTLPVTDERASGNIQAVAKIAPEVVPARQNFLASLWGTIVAILVGMWNLAGSYISSAWDFFTSNKDNLPSGVTDPNAIWSLVQKVPPSVWIFIVAFGLGLLAINARKSVKKITEAVQNGER